MRNEVNPDSGSGKKSGGKWFNFFKVRNNEKMAAVRRITDSRLFWAIISILISVFLWMYVTASQGEDYRRAFQGVKVEFQGEEALRKTRADCNGS